MDTFNEAWDVICDYLKNKRENDKKVISDVAYNAWIKKIKPVSIDFTTKRIVLSVPNNFNKTVIENSYLGILKVTSEEVFGDEFNFVIEIDSDEGNHPAEENTTSNKEDANQSNRYGDEYTFDTFVVGKSNELAYKASPFFKGN